MMTMAAQFAACAVPIIGTRQTRQTRQGLPGLPNMKNGKLGKLGKLDEKGQAGGQLKERAPTRVSPP